ncbi:MAG: recombination regulator RecX [Spirochaetaceae bacterium]|nr:recombination regulator RecX [Spirochaetaceae bacterium]
MVSLKGPAKPGSPVLRITLSDGVQFSFSTAYLDSGVETPEPGLELTPVLAVCLRRAADCYRAERAALRFIARAEQTRSGLTRKLTQKGLESRHVEAVLDRLEFLEILNDRRYAEMWLKARLRLAPGGLSPRKLLASLTGRGVAPGLAREAVKQALDAEAEAALIAAYLAALSRKEARRRNPSGAARSGALRFRLRAEGFSAAAIRAWEEEHDASLE